MVKALITLGLTRIQFTFTVVFHIIFPAITVGLSLFLVLLEFLHLKTKKSPFSKAYVAVSKLFSVAFALGIISGITISFQFGVNWTGFMHYAGAIIGQLLTFEVLTAFFLEAGSIGIMLFGKHFAGAQFHFLSTSLVAAGTFLSTFWISATNSWMQSPRGFAIVNDQMIPSSWFKLIFNPAFWFRFPHGVFAILITAAGALLSINCWGLLQENWNVIERLLLAIATKILLIIMICQLILGDLHGLNTLYLQPHKISSIESVWTRNCNEVPFNVFCFPSENSRCNRVELSIKHLGSLLLTHRWKGMIFAITDFKRKCSINSCIIFYSFRLMIATSGTLLTFALWSSYSLTKHFQFEFQLLLLAATMIGPLGYVAFLSGWITAEVGRQPWLIFGIIKVAQGISKPRISEMLLSFIIIITLYSTLFAAGWCCSFFLISNSHKEQSQIAID